MNVLVIYGGNSSERDISLISGTNVGDALAKSGHRVTYFDPASGNHKLRDAVIGNDSVFPILHGTGGEDGKIQKQLETLGIPYVGSRSDVSRACFDKWKTITTAKDILFPASELVTYLSIKSSPLIQKPFVIKPRAEGSSVDTFLIRDPAKFNLKKLNDVFAKYDDELIIEELIDGKEITVGILDKTPLPVVEIIPPAGQEFDFSNKYNGATAENCPPKFIDESLQIEAQGIALKLHTIMGCKDFSRSDMIIDKQGNIYTLEINTLPGMTPESLYPRAAKAAGYSVEQLVDRLVELSIK